ncbi:MAG: hypothetical protein ACOX2K_05180 [Bacillota bacterium]
MTRRSFAMGLRALLQAQPDIQVVAEAGNGQEATDRRWSITPTWC